MKIINRLITAVIIAILIPFTVVSGQEKKNQQQIKIVIAQDDGSKVIIDTLITGNSENDSIVLKDGKTIYLTETDSDDAGVPGSKMYFITSSSSDGGDIKKEVRKEITIISSESDRLDEPDNDNFKQAECESLVSSRKYVYTVESDNKDVDSESTKYVIKRNGVIITVEGSDYAKVKETIKDIEKILDEKSEVK